MAEIRVYAELNDFLAPARRGIPLSVDVPAHASVKHVLETLGVPHTEVGLVLRNGEPCDLAQRALKAEDRLSVYPPWRSLLPAPGGSRRFIADAHLGRLARWLRFAGYDTLWHETGPDAELAAVAAREDRIVLTRDRALLMHRGVARGCHLRPDEPLAQLAELASRLDLQLHEPSRPPRCMVCNAVPHEVPAAEVGSQVPPRTREAFTRFWRCEGCGRVYWHGSHWRRMRAELDGLSDATPRRPC